VTAVAAEQAAWFALKTTESLPFDLPFPGAGGLGPGAGQLPADAGVVDHREQSGTSPGRVLGQTIGQVRGPPLDLP